MAPIVPLLSFVPMSLREPKWVVIYRLEAYQYCVYKTPYDMDGLDAWMYKDFVYTPLINTTELTGRHGSKCRPSPFCEGVLKVIKEGDGLNTYWRVNYYDEKKRIQTRIEGNSNGGKKSKRGNTISDEELIERAKGEGSKARYARWTLKKRGIDV